MAKASIALEKGRPDSSFESSNPKTQSFSGQAVLPARFVLNVALR